MRTVLAVAVVSPGGQGGGGGDVCLVRGGLINTPPQKSWHMLVKTIPNRNYIADGKNVTRPVPVTCSLTN